MKCIFISSLLLLSNLCFSQAKIEQELTNDSVYIPRNIKECFLQLDKILSKEQKNEMIHLSNNNEMIKYHFTIGTWIRNNWGLRNDSVLNKYFKRHKIDHPEYMSSTILEYYYDWLHKRNESWQGWEREKY